RFPHGMSQHRAEAAARALQRANALFTHSAADAVPGVCQSNIEGVHGWKEEQREKGGRGDDGSLSDGAAGPIGARLWSRNVRKPVANNETGSSPPAAPGPAGARRSCVFPLSPIHSVRLLLREFPSRLRWFAPAVPINVQAMTVIDPATSLFRSEYELEMEAWLRSRFRTVCISYLILGAAVILFRIVVTASKSGNQ